MIPPSMSWSEWLGNHRRRRPAHKNILTNTVKKKEKEKTCNFLFNVANRSSQPYSVSGAQVLQNYLTTGHQYRTTVFIACRFQNLLHWSNNSCNVSTRKAAAGETRSFSLGSRTGHGGIQRLHGSDSAERPGVSAWPLEVSALKFF